MAKKVRRPKKRTVVSEATAAENEAKSISKAAAAQEAFESEYAYVLKDLRWVFILAAVMFTLLIVLNLVLSS